MAVDGEHQVIVAVGISNQASDTHHLLPHAAEAVAIGRKPEIMIPMR
jgi:hypothetical protein